MNSTPLTHKYARSVSLAPALFVFALPAAAEPHDVSWGGELHAQNCAGCHSAPHNAAFYESKQGGKIKSAQSLNTMVQSCANHFNLPWFDEEVTAVSTYLNQSYYHLD